MMISSIGYVLIRGMIFCKSAIILLLVLYRAIDAYSDVFQRIPFSNKINVSDLAGKVQFYQLDLYNSLWFSLLLTKSLMISSIVICLTNLYLQLS